MRKITTDDLLDIHEILYRDEQSQLARQRYGGFGIGFGAASLLWLIASLILRG